MVDEKGARDGGGKGGGDGEEGCSWNLITFRLSPHHGTLPGSELLIHAAVHAHSRASTAKVCVLQVVVWKVWVLQVVVVIFRVGPQPGAGSITHAGLASPWYGMCRLSFSEEGTSVPKDR